MNDQVPRYPLLRILLGNAFLLSGIYLAVGLMVESLRRWSAVSWAEDASQVLDRLPARVLLLLGALSHLRELYLAEELPEWGLRLIFGVTTIAVIFGLAVVVGTGMWAVNRAWEWHVGRRATRPR